VAVEISEIGKLEIRQQDIFTHSDQFKAGFDNHDDCIQHKGAAHQHICSIGMNPSF
jgi:hypothetical protein